MTGKIYQGLLCDVHKTNLPTPRRKDAKDWNQAHQTASQLISEDSSVPRAWFLNDKNIKEWVGVNMSGF